MTTRLGLSVMLMFTALSGACARSAPGASSAAAATSTASNGGAAAPDCARCGWFTPQGPATAEAPGATCARPVRVSSPDPNMSVDTHGVTDPCAPTCCAR